MVRHLCCQININNFTLACVCLHRVVCECEREDTVRMLVQ